MQRICHIKHCGFSKRCNSSILEHVTQSANKYKTGNRIWSRHCCRASRDANTPESGDPSVRRIGADAACSSI